MAQTSVVGYTVSPSGHRMVVQAGTHAFTTSATLATLTVHMRKVVAALVHPNQAVGSTFTSKVGAYIPFVSTTQYTAWNRGSIKVSRTTGNITGLKFSYTLIGQ